MAAFITTKKYILGPFSLHFHAYIVTLFYVIQFDVDLVLYRKLVHNQVVTTVLYAVMHNVIFVKIYSTKNFNIPFWLIVRVSVII